MRDGIGALRATGLTRQERMGREIRRARGALSQTELGARVGRPQSTVSMWECGRLPVSLEMLARIEAALGLVPGVLLVEAGCLDLEALLAWASGRRASDR